MAETKMVYVESIWSKSLQLLTCYLEKNVSYKHVMSFIKYEHLYIRKQRVFISSHDSTHGVLHYVK